MLALNNKWLVFPWVETHWEVVLNFEDQNKVHHNFLEQFSGKKLLRY